MEASNKKSIKHLERSYVVGWFSGFDSCRELLAPLGTVRKFKLVFFVMPHNKPFCAKCFSFKGDIFFINIRRNLFCTACVRLLGTTRCVGGYFRNLIAMTFVDSYGRFMTDGLNPTLLTR